MNHLPLIQRNNEKIKAMLKKPLSKSNNISSLAGGKKFEPTLVVIRHGSTSLNNESDERIRGWMDVPLAPEGIQEVKDNLPALKEAKIDGLIASDLSRTVHTAKIISDELGIPILGTSPALRPWNLGVMTGRRVKLMIPAMMSFIDHPDEVVPGGESFNSFKNRTIKFIQHIQNKYPYDKIGIVTHHRDERLINGWVKDGKPTNPIEIKNDVFKQKGIPPGGFTDYEVPPQPVPPTGGDVTSKLNQF